MIPEICIMFLGVSSCAKRRRAIGLVIGLLEKIRAAEMAYMNSVPESLQDNDDYVSADCSVEIITDSIERLADAY